MNKIILTAFITLFFSSNLLSNEFSWADYQEEIGHDYISKYKNSQELPAEQTKKYIKRVHKMDIERESLSEIKAKKNDKLSVGLVFRNPKIYSGTNTIIGDEGIISGDISSTSTSEELDMFGLKMSAALDLSALGWSGRKYANINVFSDLVEMTISKRIFLSDFDLGIFDSMNRWNGPFLEAGVGLSYQIKETINEEGMSPMIMFGGGWNLNNNYEVKGEASIPSNYTKGTVSRFSISSLF